jgi:acyl-CoA hydrolase
MTGAPQVFDDAEALAAAIVSECDPSILLALPLGLGNANHVANALYALAAATPSVKLRIFTALTLEKPVAQSELERRFLEPVVDRLFGGYPELAYAKALRANALPPNIDVDEFFFLAGRWLNVPRAQQNYISANYTHAARYVLDRGVSVVAQLVAKRVINGEIRYSLSCNTDVTLDLLKARAAGTTKFLLVGQVNSELPFMPGDGDLPASEFSHILEGPACDFPLFAPPREPISLAEYATGIHVASLVPDGGTLQIGIGSEGDAAVRALIMRHRNNATFRDAIGRLSPADQHCLPREYRPFETGLHGLSEMFVDGFLELIDAGVLKREVDGALLHGAFFVGPKSFYKALREMSDAERARLRMTAISFVNELYGDEEAKKRARPKARFVNSTMMVTLLGAAVSDGLEDGRVVSGVGGQYNFVSQAFALPDARSILTLKATRTAHGRTTSNILWSYGHETIPRHLRDIVVTEYGVADLRGKSDRDVIGAMLAIADSRFQPELLRQARDARKIPANYEIPPEYRENAPEKIERALGPYRTRGMLTDFPFGTDFTAIELALMPALQTLDEATHSPRQLLHLLFRGAFASDRPDREAACLARLRLDNPQTARDRLYRALVRGALRATVPFTSGRS